ncbi:MAG: DUF1573 domain-containing protein [Planctomycetota bacterium]|nr:DUF1573 domain-containing protein [Planctomycetota bacterium]
MSLWQTRAEESGPPTGPRALQFETPEVALGRLRAGSVRLLSLPWQRTGPGPLRVLEARTDCGCALIESAPRELAERARGRLRVRVTAPRRPGPMRHRVRVVTDGPPGHDVHDVWISAHVDVDVAVKPSTVSLPPGPTGSEVQAVLEVAWDRSTHGARLLPRARLIALEGEIDVGPPPRPGADAVQIVATLRRPAKPGRISGWIEVDLGDRGPIAVPVRGTVVPARPEGGASLDR